jgi:hypothetical protein
MSIKHDLTESREHIVDGKALEFESTPSNPILLDELIEEENPNNSKHRHMDPWVHHISYLVSFIDMY